MKKINRQWNLITNIMNGKAMILTFIVIGLIIVQQKWFVDWNISGIKEISIIEFSFVGFNYLYLSSMKKTKSFQTYLIFLIIAKIFVLALAILGKDLSKIIDNKTGTSSSDIDQISMMLSYIGNVGITFVSAIIVPYVILSHLLNYIDYRVVSKTTGGTTRNLWYLFITLAEIALFYLIMYFINKWLNDFSIKLWDKMAIGTTVENTVYGMVAKTLYSILRPVLLLGWLPALIVINKMRGGHVFNDKGPQIHIALKISLLVSYIDMYNKYNVAAGIDVQFTIIMIVILSIAQVIQTALIIVAMWRNVRIMNNNFYVPHMIKIKPKVNKTVKQMRQSNGKVFNLFYER